jgi:hypothetical protein
MVTPHTGGSAVPLFTFYPCRSDGSSVAFETLDCPNDLEALVRARRVLDEHMSAVEVVIWQGERHVGALSRVADPA